MSPPASERAECIAPFGQRIGGCVFFFLSPRRRSGERTEERGCVTPARKAPPLPVPLLHRLEEREWLRLSRVLRVTPHVAPQPRGADGAARRPYLSNRRPSPSPMVGKSRCDVPARVSASGTIRARRADHATPCAATSRP